MNEFMKLYEKFPFLTLCRLKDVESFIGIILNKTKSFTSIYSLYDIKKEHKAKFLELGEIWWFESNRKLPISIFLKEDIKLFKYVLRNFPTKDLEIMIGPVTCLSDLADKRIKRKLITLKYKKNSKIT